MSNELKYCGHESDKERKATPSEYITIKRSELESMRSVAFQEGCEDYHNATNALIDQLLERK